MARPDRYDYIGLGLLGLLVVMWVAHFVLPEPPPDPRRLEDVAPQALPVGPSIPGPSIPGPSIPSIRPR